MSIQNNYKHCLNQTLIFKLGYQINPFQSLLSLWIRSNLNGLIIISYNYTNYLPIYGKFHDILLGIYSNYVSCMVTFVQYKTKNTRWITMKTIPEAEPIWDVFRPIFWYQRLSGLWMQSFKVRIKKKGVKSIIHT